MEIKVGIVNPDEKKQLWQISQQTMTIEVDPHPYRPDEYDRFLQKIQQGKAIMMIENLNVLGALIYYPSQHLNIPFGNLNYLFGQRSKAKESLKNY